MTPQAEGNYSVIQSGINRRGRRGSQRIEKFSIESHLFLCEPLRPLRLLLRVSFEDSTPVPQSVILPVRHAVILTVSPVSDIQVTKEFMRV
jgi:hypothetical protein